MKAVSDQNVKDDLLRKFDADIRAASSTATAVSTWSTWCKFHNAWFGEESPPIPLDPIKIRAVGACFKEGAYRAFAPYLSKAKEEHILAGYLWSDLLDLSGRRANRSVTRGVGVSRQSKPFDLAKALEAAATPGFTPAKDAPIGWKNLLVVATFFVLREIEVAFSLVVHITIDTELLKITLLLPVSKKDPRAIGCERSWTCTCVDGPASRHDCPYHAAVQQLALLEKTFGIPLPPKLPLFPQPNGKHVDKATVVEALEATVIAYGGLVRSPTGTRLFGGHSFRVSGAQMLAALGIEVVKIMVLARWAGETVLRYIREAPLAHLADEVKALEGKRNLLSLFDKLADGAEKLTGKVQDLEEQLLHLQRERKRHTAAAASTEDTESCGRPYVTNGAKKASMLKVHKVMISGLGKPLTSWRTICGFRFAFSDGERLNSYKEFESCQRCKRCGLIDEIIEEDEKSGSSSTSNTDSSAQSADDVAITSQQSASATGTTPPT